MRRFRSYATPPSVAAGAATGGAEALGGSTTECSAPGNIQIDATPPEQTYANPWDDEFYGPALIFDGGGGHR